MNADEIDDLCELNATCVQRAPDFAIAWVDGDGFVATWTWEGAPNTMISGPRHHNDDGFKHALTALLTHAARQIRMAGRRRAA